MATSEFVIDVCDLIVLLRDGHDRQIWLAWLNDLF